MRRPSTRFTAFLVVTFLAAGCGGDDEPESSSGRADTTPSSRDVTSVPSRGGDQQSGSRGGVDTEPNRSGRGTDTTPSKTDASAAPSQRALKRRGLASCIKNVDRIPQLTASDKATRAIVKKECEKTFSGDSRAEGKFSTAGCVKIALRAVPSGPTRDVVVKACRREGK